MQPQETPNSQTYYWVTSFFSIIGMVFNSLFLLISTENPEKRNLTDLTMLSASITMIIKSFGLFINGFLAKSQGSEAIFGQLQNGLVLCTETYCNEEDDISLDYDQQEFHQRGNERTITNRTNVFQNWGSGRVSETSCTSTNSTQLSTRCSSLSATLGKKIESNLCDFFLDENLTSLPQASTDLVESVNQHARQSISDVLIRKPSIVMASVHPQTGRSVSDVVIRRSSIAALLKNDSYFSDVLSLI
ncbi:Hypothetical predicted protein [Mytilus galloprovincialis]|uniref:Uncharacterized protein n=1 Tax=Mytilus galloprovincialis TaxID=29158 RepID=A0A8B6DVL9_MYTGA|nr:Hypothetical predicted protein [Mytilus galloprovincialis]